MRWMVLGLVAAIGFSLSLMGCDSMNSGRDNGAQGNQAGSYQDAYPKSPSSGTHDSGPSYNR